MRMIILALALMSTSVLAGTIITGEEMHNELIRFTDPETGHTNDGSCYVFLGEQGRGEYYLEVGSIESNIRRRFLFSDDSRILRVSKGTSAFDVSIYQVNETTELLEVITCEDGACHVVNANGLSCKLPSA